MDGINGSPRAPRQLVQQPPIGAREWLGAVARRKQQPADHLALMAERQHDELLRRRGGRAAGVGAATTSAVVSSILGIIVLDAVFALCANALNV